MSADKLFTKIPAPFDLFEIDLQSASIKDLQSISEKMGLALAVQEMTAIKQYFQKKKRHPTDIELQALGQAWSEPSFGKVKTSDTVETAYLWHRGRENSRS